MKNNKKPETSQDAHLQQINYPEIHVWISGQAF